jgi:hypothetical protein
MRRCPQCKSERVFSSQRRSYWEVFCQAFLVRGPFRCGESQHRFYGFSFDAETRARIGSSLFVLFLVLGLSWGIWIAIDTLVTGVTKFTPSRPSGPGRPR